MLISYHQDFLEKALCWANQHNYCAYLCPNDKKNYPYTPFMHVLAIGAKNVYQPEEQSFEQIAQQKNKWLFGYWSYDLKNEVESHLKSDNAALQHWKKCTFFEPEHILFFDEKHCTIQSETPQEVINNIQGIQSQLTITLPPIAFEAKTSQTDYIQQVKRIQDYIIQGDVYELNYCIPFVAENVTISPLAAFWQLNQMTQMPFAAFLRCKQHYLMCASPERFLKKEGQQLISQPIKGTAKRSPDKQEDEQIKQQLRNSPKEQAENMMIVDLVRNDLARFAVVGSTQVAEMFGIYTFSQMHQMISTITAELHPQHDWHLALKQAFPMGSMTGAPKIRAMEIIEELEDFKRELFSGAVGYITPDGNFDFNVVIRSLFYNATQKTLSYAVGSAITIDSVPEEEYKECMLKAAAFRMLFVKE